MVRWLTFKTKQSAHLQKDQDHQNLYYLVMELQSCQDLP